MSSIYNPGPYGEGNYSAEDYTALAGILNIQPVFAANMGQIQAISGSLVLSIAQQGDLQFAPIDELAGVLNIQPSFVGDLKNSSIDLNGILSIQPIFAASMGQIQTISSIWQLRVGFGDYLGKIYGFGDYGIDIYSAGDAYGPSDLSLIEAMNSAWSLSIVIEVMLDVEFYTGPLWAKSNLCPPPMWAEDTLCPPPPWRQEYSWGGSNYGVGGYGLKDYGFGFFDFGYVSSIYGKGIYGSNLYSRGLTEPSPQVWVPDPLCTG